MRNLSQLALPVAFLWAHAAWAVEPSVDAAPSVPTTETPTPIEGTTAGPEPQAPASEPPAAADPAVAAAPAVAPDPAPVPELAPEPVPEPVASEPAAAPESAPSRPAKSAGPFAQGRIHVGGTVGFSTTSSGTSTRSWFILGVGAGAFVLDGLEVHADSTAWFGDPFAFTLTPGVRYVFHMVPVVKPYVGTFYRHYFIGGDRSDSDSLGARLGANLMIGRSSYVAAGVIYEHFLDSNLFSDPDQLYPEILIGFAF